MQEEFNLALQTEGSLVHDQMVCSSLFWEMLEKNPNVSGLMRTYRKTVPEKGSLLYEYTHKNDFVDFQRLFKPEANIDKTRRVKLEV